MITNGDFAKLIRDSKHGVTELAVENMTNYAVAGVPSREPFVTLVMEMLEAVSSMIYNRDGSFIEAGARQALDDEADFDDTDFELSIRLYHRMRQLEMGELNFDWIERGWIKKWRPLLFATGNPGLAAAIDNAINAGQHKFKPPKRPYVGKAVREYAPVLANEIDKLLLSRLPLRRV